MQTFLYLENNADGGVSHQLLDTDTAHLLTILGMPRLFRTSSILVLRGLGKGNTN